MIYLGTYAARGYQIRDFTAIVPLANQIGCHALLPVNLFSPYRKSKLWKFLIYLQFALGLV